MNLAVDPGFPQEREETYGFAKFHRKLHANKANWTGEGVATRSNYYYVDPPLPLQLHIQSATSSGSSGRVRGGRET